MRRSDGGSERLGLEEEEGFPDLQADAAGDGRAVLVLVVQLQMADEQLVHAAGVTGGEAVEFTLSERRSERGGEKGGRGDAIERGGRRKIDR